MSKNTFENKKIILAITKDSGFYDCFTSNLKHLDFKAIILLKNNSFKYKNFKERFLNLIYKTLLNNKNYKKNLIAKDEINVANQNKTLSEITKNYDFSLTIRADLFNHSIIKKITAKSNNAYAYQWDGLNRYPKIFDTIPLFKKQYVFDKNDLNTNTNTYPLTNFYFDCYTHLFNDIKPEYDVYYIGSYDSRIPDLIKICEELNSLGLRLNINIPCQKKHQKKLKQYSYISFPKGGFTYLENLENVAKSKIILDFHNPIHNGLSFRAFEALGYHKKLITTNNLIKDYDFYKQENFHVYENKKELVTFLEKPLIKTEGKIHFKYSFTNWLRYVLEQENGIAINFPNKS